MNVDGHNIGNGSFLPMYGMGGSQLPVPQDPQGRMSAMLRQYSPTMQNMMVPPQRNYSTVPTGPMDRQFSTANALKPPTGKMTMNLPFNRANVANRYVAPAYDSGGVVASAGPQMNAVQAARQGQPQRPPVDLNDPRNAALAAYGQW